MNVMKRLAVLKFLNTMLIVILAVTLIGCNRGKDEIILITDIQIESNISTISTNQGALQLGVTITPIDATDQNLTWEVANQTGQAIVSQSGLVTALKDGIVSVSVTSKLNSDVNDSIIISISNQQAVQYQPLADAIIEANLLINETNVGNDSNSFVPEVMFVKQLDKDNLIAAIILAQGKITESNLSSEEAAQETLILEEAITLFNNAKKPGTKVILSLDLGIANEFALLSKTGISTTGTTQIIGNVGVSPVSGAYLTGFGLMMDSTEAFSTSALVTGKLYAADYGVATPTYLTNAIKDMMTAYDEGIAKAADYNELYTGNLGGKTLKTAVYHWSNDVLINTDLTLDGTSNEVIIFQIAGTLTMAANTKIILTGGLKPENVFWLVAKTVAVDVGCRFNGVILTMTNVSFNTNANLTGMIFAQTSISLDAIIVTKP